MRLRVYSPHGKFSHLPLTALGGLRRDLLVQLRYQDYLSSGEGQVKLDQFNYGQYASLLESNTYSFYYDGVLQSSISPVCYADYPLTVDPQIIHDDGDVTISTDVSITAPKFYNNLTVTDSGILRAANHPIYVKNTCYNYGKICNDGLLGGASTPAGFFPSFGAGVAGGTEGNGSVGGNGTVGSTVTDGVLISTAPASGLGGGGGRSAGSVPGYAGGNNGATGSYTALTSFESAYRMLESGKLGRIFTLSAVKQFYGSAMPGAGGGGGSGALGEGAGGVGIGGVGGNTGSPAGILFFYATKVVGNGVFSANGGEGGNGGNGVKSTAPIVLTAGWGGGGGGGCGGNGGIVYFVCYDRTEWAGTITVYGGGGGKAGLGGANTNPLIYIGGSGADGTGGNTGNPGVVLEFTEALY